MSVYAIREMKISAMRSLMLMGSDGLWENFYWIKGRRTWVYTLGIVRRLVGVDSFYKRMYNGTTSLLGCEKLSILDFIEM